MPNHQTRIGGLGLDSVGSSLNMTSDITRASSTTLVDLQ